MPDSGSSKHPLATVYIIDDDARLRVSLQDFFDLVGQRARAFESAFDFLEQSDLTQPGCILLDIRMPGMTGLELQAKLTDQGYPLPIIFMTGNASVGTSVSAMKAGAFDYLLKPFSSESLIKATNLALDRNAEERGKSAALQHVRDGVASLTPREAEVFGFVSKGLMNKQIAHEMGISEIMVKLHRGRVMKKLEARSVVDLVRIFDEAHQQGSK
ncbi:response regulator transcription factor [Rhizobium grahamii]|uniref:Signal transduction response regulator LuxR family protein n=2 Tax=Rhizobium grahamii TaxID=1120045 RepID=S3H7F0_9HYPH|nr:response regulator [Rhizobium grahamii]EPE94160.1 Signal transduction response regulator LuxR family protein [Rhizobium grahamii CCGE 502]RDJ05731.1 DNA-binding response regulator [Rhizobium grahamii]